MKKANILIVEDEAVVAHEIKGCLEKMGHSVVSIASRGDEAVRKSEQKGPDLILMDIQLKGQMDGIEAAHIIQHRLGIPVIFLTAYDDDERLKRAKLTLPYGYVLKPFQDRELRIAIEMALYAAEMNARRRLAEEKLKESEKRFRSLIEQAVESIFLHDLDGRLILVNRAACERLGYQKRELLSLEARDVDPDLVERGDKEKIWHRLMEKAPVIFESRHKRKDGTVFPVEVSLSPIQYGNRQLIMAMARDISDRKRALAQAWEIHKKETVAAMAGGIAHEFNNALMGVMGGLELVRLNFSKDSPVGIRLETIKSACHRMSCLTAQLLAYSEGGKYQPKDMKMDDFVMHTLTILQHDLNPGVRVETRFPNRISYVKADHTQMQMVLSAVLANANEAIENEGLIRITVEDRDIDADFSKQHACLEPGPYVCLTIEDDGKGMDRETRNGIFEPFFTTKFKGRGMGMAAAHGIVKNHGGWISVDSELGKGTVVHICLPAIQRAVAEKPEKERVMVAHPLFPSDMAKQGASC